MNLLIFLIIFSMCHLKILKSELLNPKEVNRVLNLTKLINEEELEMCQKALKNDYYPEIPYVYMYCDENLDPVRNEPNAEYCEGFDCWESQLSLFSRVEIVHIMNQYRERVSRRMCHKWCEQNKKLIIFELVWDYTIENKAVDIIKNCPLNKTDNGTSVFDPGDGTNVTSRMDLSVTSFKMVNGSQKELRIILWQLMMENHLNDWDENTWQFRRSLMHDVGCAFVIRRHINYVTARNETVQNGIVGHFGCVFQSLLESEQPPDSLEPSSSNCKSQAGRVLVAFDSYNYFPNLCRIDPPINEVVLTRASHFCKEGPKNVKNLCTSSSTSNSSQTWEEKFYGLTLRLVNSTGLQVKGDCNVPKNIPQPKQFGSDIVNYNCTLKEEVLMRADISKCVNWNCDDSQLTDITRLKILDLLNEARQLAANGGCWSECEASCPCYNTSIRYCNMVKLQWHWYLEQKASQLIEDCTRRFLYQRNVTYDDSPFPDPVVFEDISLQWVSNSSEDAGQIWFEGWQLISLFWNNKFKDWSPTDGKFRRGNAMFVGCSIYVENDVNGTRLRFICIFAALQKEFFSIPETTNNTASCCPTCPEPVYQTRPCQLHYVKQTPPYPDLCTSVALSLTQNCQSKWHCSNKGHSVAWDEAYAGTTAHQTSNGSFVAVERTRNTTPSSTFSPSPSPSPSPTPTPSPIFTSTPSPTSTSTPSPTPTRTPKSDNYAIYAQYCLFLFILTTILTICFLCVVIMRWKSEETTLTLPAQFSPLTEKPHIPTVTTQVPIKSESTSSALSTPTPELKPSETVSTPTPKLKPSGIIRKVPKNKASLFK